MSAAAAAIALLLTGCMGDIEEPSPILTTVPETAAAVTEVSAETTTTTTTTTAAETTTKKTTTTTKKTTTKKKTSAAAQTTATPPPATTAKQTTAAPATTTAKAATAEALPAGDPPTVGGYNKVEVYKKITFAKLLEGTGITPDDQKACVPTDKLGKQSVKIKIGGKEEVIGLDVVDTQAPVFFYAPSVITVEYGSSFDLNFCIGFGDNYDAHPKCSYSGNVNTYAAGDYPINITIKDSSGNTRTQYSTVSVVSYMPGWSSGLTAMNFADFCKKYKAANADFGLDVSAWQGNIDFNKVKKSGCSFVFIRCAHHSDDFYVDQYFDQNLKNALAAGIDTGVYIFTTCSTPKQAREHAQWVIKKLGGQKLQLPIAFDWESFDKFQNCGLSIHTLNECYRAFREEIEAAGYECILYNSKNFLETVWEPDTLDNVWLANYTERTEYSGKYQFWQQGIGRIDGIDGDVDLNVRYR